MPQDNITPTPTPTQASVSGQPNTIDPVDPAANSQSTSDETVTLPQSPVVDAAIPTDTQAPVVATPPLATQPSAPSATENLSNIYTEVISKIGNAKNVLVALSSDPSVDEMAAAIGFSLYLDRLGKRATAIYSGSTPNALEFLKPEETFEPSADTLQDFVIAINKEKADHLRYKLDGDYVKVYITPYRTRLSENDLEFSYGDYNVDLVLALDVTNGIDLDSALREHGRIMHDAVIVNITTGNPGKFGEIEWSDKSASSVSEMIASFLYEFGGEAGIAKDEATAFLTGIVAATNRFSNAKTTSHTMQIASKLMESGANQQLVAKNITPDVDNELLFSLSNNTEIDSAPESDGKSKSDPTKLDIEHDYEKRAKENEKKESDASTESDSSTTSTDDDVESNQPKEISAEVTPKEHTLLDDLKAAEASLSQAGVETVPTDEQDTLKIENGALSSPEPVEPKLPPVSISPAPSEATSEATAEQSPETSSEESSLTTPTISPEPTSLESTTSDAVEESTLPKETSSDDGLLEEKTEKVLEPSADFNASAPTEDVSKYSQMVQDALNASNITSDSVATPTTPNPSDNPAAMNAPVTPSAPEINGVPEMNFMPMPGDEVLPPPPTPPIDIMTGEPLPANTSSPEPPASVESTSSTEPVAPIVTPTTPDTQSATTQAPDPSAFQIPGM